MMSLNSRCIAVLAFLILDCYVLSLSARLNIQRGDQDIFDKPNCGSLAGSGCECKNSNAFCFGSCERCQCSWNDTFISSNYSNGRCVKNRRLLFIPTTPNSFLVKSRIGLECMKPNINDKMTKTNCDANDSGKRWIWTRNNQLMHVDSFRCLQQGPCAIRAITSGYYYYSLVLKECKTTVSKQLWQCRGQNNAIFRLRNPILYMYQTSFFNYIYGINGTFNATRINWQRWPSNENLCSKAFGCYEFVASAIFVTDLIPEEREISIPHTPGEKLCFVMWDKLQYLDNDDWKQSPFRDEIFTVEKRNNTQTYLKLNYANATNDWTGLIVKLQFYCAAGQSTQVNATQVNATDTTCVVIKFKGSIYPPTVPPTVSTTYSQPTTSRTTEKQSPTKAEKSQSDSSYVAVIVVCVVIAILILCGVLGFIFYRRRRRSGEEFNIFRD